jgi:hypothetical protein
MLPQKKDMGVLALQIANFASNQLPITGGERSVDGSTGAGRSSRFDRAEAFFLVFFIYFFSSFFFHMSSASNVYLSCLGPFDLGVDASSSAKLD